MRPARALTRTSGSWLAAIASAIAASQLSISAPPQDAGSSDAPDAGAVFDARKDELKAVGVHRAGGFVFSSAQSPAPADAGERMRKAAEGKAGVQAVRQMIEWHVGQTALNGIPDGPLRDAMMDAGASCFSENVSLAGMLTVLAEYGTDSVTVVRAVPESRLAAAPMDRARLIECLTARIAAGKARPVDVLLREEISPAEGTTAEQRRTELASQIARIVGPGIELSLAGRWTSSDRSICPACLAGWTGIAADSVAKSGSCGEALSPLPAAMMAKLSLDDLLQIAAARVNDPTVMRALNDRLSVAGLARSAELLRFPVADARPFEDRPGSRLDRAVRAKVVRSPIVAALLLTDGNLDVTWGASPACLREATDAYEQDTPDSVARSISLLADGMGTTPNADALSLLAAALLASDEARLAEPLARAAFAAMPTHKFAGVNALRAQRALGLKEEARELFPRVAAQGEIGNWGRRQLESIAQWLEVPLPPAPSDQAPGGEK